MIEKIVTSKTRAKLLNLFLTHTDNRYYLRELERMLDESLSPLRRQLLKLVKIGILVTEEEANLKYYRLNRNFAGMEELRRLVLGSGFSTPLDISDVKGRSNNIAGGQEIASPPGADRNDREAEERQPKGWVPARRVRYDAMVLTAVAFFVLATAVFVVYTSTRNIKQVVSLVAEAKTPLTPTLSPEGRGGRSGEMISKRWKLLPGAIPVLSSGETGGERRSEEL